MGTYFLLWVLTLYYGTDFLLWVLTLYEKLKVFWVYWVWTVAPAIGFLMVFAWYSHGNPCPACPRTFPSILSVLTLDYGYWLYTIGTDFTLYGTDFVRRVLTLYYGYWLCIMGTDFIRTLKTCSDCTDFEQWLVPLVFSWFSHGILMVIHSQRARGFFHSY